MAGERRRPRSLRRLGLDPAADARRLAEQVDERLTEWRAGRAVWAARPPVLVVAGAAMDLLRVRADPRVDVLAPQELQEAAQRANIDLAAARAAEEPSLQGFISAVRGTAGELHALDQLAAGSLPAPPGTAQVDLIEHTYPGVDLSFSDAAGHVIDTANVKIAADPGIALRHLGRHPDVRLVYAPTDTAERLGTMGFTVVQPDGDIPVDGPAIIDLGRPTVDFDQEVRSALDATVVDASTPLSHLVPWFGLAAVGTRAVRRLASGASAGDQRRLVTGDLAVTAAAATSGRVTTLALGSGFAGIPFALVAAWVSQAAVATQSSWRDAAKRQRQLQEAVQTLNSRP